MSPSLRDRLTEARHARFVGHDGDLSIFESALTAEYLPFFVLHIFGPGGVGQTSLLQEFVRLSEEKGARSVYLDARHIDLSPDVFIKTLSALLGHHKGASLPDVLDAPQRTVILIDAYANLTPLDSWLRTTFLPQLPEKVLTVLAGCNHPDPAWQDFVRVISLHNLSHDESRAFLTRRGLPPEQQQSVLEFRHGHPLALSLVAEVFSQRGYVSLHPEELITECGQIADGALRAAGSRAGPPRRSRGLFNATHHHRASAQRNACPAPSRAGVPSRRRLFPSRLVPSFARCWRWRQTKPRIILLRACMQPEGVPCDRWSAAAARMTAQACESDATQMSKGSRSYDGAIKSVVGSGGIARDLPVTVRRD